MRGIIKISAMKSMMTGTFPFYRPRRLRQTPELRSMVRESTLRPEQLILPLFVTEGTQKRIPVPSMPGVFQLSIDELLAETRSAWETGVRAILLFGIDRKSVV